MAVLGLMRGLSVRILIAWLILLLRFTWNRVVRAELILRGIGAGDRGRRGRSLILRCLIWCRRLLGRRRCVSSWIRRLGIRLLVRCWLVVLRIVGRVWSERLLWRADHRSPPVRVLLRRRRRHLGLLICSSVLVRGLRIVLGLGARAGWLLVLD